jgi:hypothetical protein
MTSLGTRMHMAWLALVDPVRLVAYQQGGRGLARDEAERVAEIVIGQVNKPIAGLYEEIAGTTDALNQLSAALVRLEAFQVDAQTERAAGFERIYALIETIVAEKEHAHAALHAEIRDVREAASILHQAFTDLDRRVGALEAQAWPIVTDAPGD